MALWELFKSSVHVTKASPSPISVPVAKASPSPVTPLTSVKASLPAAPKVGTPPVAKATPPLLASVSPLPVAPSQTKKLAKPTSRLRKLASSPHQAPAQEQPEVVSAKASKPKPCARRPTPKHAPSSKRAKTMATLEGDYGGPNSMMEHAADASNAFAERLGKALIEHGSPIFLDLFSGAKSPVANALSKLKKWGPQPPPISSHARKTYHRPELLTTLSCNQKHF